MRKIFLIITIVFIVVIVIPAISLFVYSKLYHKSLNNDIVQYINNKFEEQVSFKDFSFSYLRRFPRIQIELEEVSVSDNNKEVISIGKLDVIVNLRSLWNKKLNIERLIIKDAAIFSRN